MREKKLVNLIKEALEKDHLYSDDELHYLKKELKTLRQDIELKRKLNHKGF